MLGKKLFLYYSDGVQGPHSFFVLFPFYFLYLVILLGFALEANLQP